MNIIYIRAPKDVNGNPRRGWIIQTPTGETFIDEGYEGHSALYEWLGAENPWCSTCSWHVGSGIFDMYVTEIWKDVSVREYEYYKYESLMVNA